ncbi:short chain dehydrogenase reductase [Thozetella sp. PMI_491]|nr:short chain dehydrogenase reductase [Thozetella sp. PMI_491]
MSSYPPSTPENGFQFTKRVHSRPYPFICSAKHAGHHVLITGGTRGIGRATAVAFARSGASAIAVADISESCGQLADELESEARNYGHEPPQIVLIRLDVSDEKSVQECASIIRQKFNMKLDILVNNAGFMTPARTIPKSDTNTWWRTMEVNLKGPYLMSKHFVPILLSTTGGLKTIININSIAAHNLRPQASAYGTSKFAVLKLTEFLLVDAADQGLVAYSIHPGAVLTELAEKGMPPETLSGLGDSPELAGATIAWLSSETRAWLSGRYLSATWDMEELLQLREDIAKHDKLKVRLVV